MLAALRDVRDMLEKEKRNGSIDLHLRGNYFRVKADRRYVKSSSF